VPHAAAVITMRALNVTIRAVSILFMLISAVAVAAEPNRWTIDYGASKLAFTAEQAQAKFDGAFTKFDADVRFDPNALGDSRADVVIDTASVTTADKERDGILSGDGWFETSAYPQARFSAKTFAQTADGFEARGDLKIRDKTVPVVFKFTLTENGGRTELHGSADLDRFAFGLGLGDWADTKWIGGSVHVVVTLIPAR
jgi:polyisoprenoid-binding protein YceI